MTRQDRSDGSVRYQVTVDLKGDASVVARTYRCPQPGLRVAHAPYPEPEQPGNTAAPSRS
ncbi:hypothetical protein GCM10010358_76900 [Streptomyces minutiscleroticus]|uniref:Uncharacterized protein n=1 Tax=Streptomyces minutiscleroticus TaxID=68238 RepID=A0A918P1X3_9ACTN|nr:hypothetical protein [Streptomyces minutiscleroticus]GGY13214.1 hypothetical protein GCM10010358_76900 [Streptomyces minutiscleroticus]